MVAKFGVAAGVDPRLPRPRRRLRRRLPRHPRVGGEERRGRARPLRAPRGHPGSAPGTGTSPGCAAAQAGRRRCATTSSWPCCSGASPRSRPTSTSARSTTGSGTARRREFDDWAVASAPRLAERAAKLAASPARSASCSRWRLHSDENRRRTDDPSAVRRRPGDLRHTGGTAEGCYLPVLTWFTGTRCTGPDRHLTAHGSGGRQATAPRAGTLAPTSEGCESGRIGTLGKRVWGNPPWVRIPLPPP